MGWFSRRRDKDRGAGPERPSDEVEALLARARNLGDDGDWTGMAGVLRDALDDHPDDPFVLCWLGVAERELGLGSLASERFKACLRGRPRDPHVLTTAGSALAEIADPDAEAALRTASLLAPEMAMARLMYGSFLSRAGLIDEALRELQAARSVDPDDAAISYELGVALALAGNWEGAVDELHRATELDPDDDWARVVLGLCLLEEGRDDEGYAELARGASGRPEDAEAQVLAALAAAAEEDEDRAWTFLERARQVVGGEASELIDAAEEALDGGPDDARRLLERDVQSGALRERLQERP